LIKEKIDADGDGDIDHLSCFAYDGYQIVLQFDKDGSGAVTGGNLSHRYLWQPDAVDQIMSDEQVTSTQMPGTVVWPLADNLGTVRDLAISENGTTTVVNHRVFDSFGNLKSSINPTTNQAAIVDCIFGWTGRPVSKATGLQYNLNRWYDPIVGGWISQDPIGFKSGTTKLDVYCGNNPTNFIDPSGLADGYGHYFYKDYIGWWWPWGSSPPPIPNPPPGTFAVAGQVAKYVAQKGMPLGLSMAPSIAQAGVGANVIGQLQAKIDELALAQANGAPQKEIDRLIDELEALKRKARPYFPQ
jgi:RHS repeat-associated protein